MSTRDKALYLAKLAEQAERYDEMASHMEAVASTADELSVEERNLLSVAYKKAVGGRHAAWRAASSVEEKEKAEGRERLAEFAKEYRLKLEGELLLLCEEVLGLLEKRLIARASSGESRVFYRKMKADYRRYIAEFSEGEEKERARLAYEEVACAMDRELPATHPIRLGSALSRCVFQYEVLNNREEACKMARAAFEGAMAELDNVDEETYRETTVIMQLLRDNLTLWTSEDAQ